ncbi:hypothetical protein AB0H71_12840 [Nocardia sp. NPDC050697]|uniref:hypothetical protein n=1 Tax=Nocardia sp. NPDC050697 TaxID=3155158 RepID=UPI00341102B7
MSMHLIEDLVEGSVRALHATGEAGWRDHFAVLYGFQSEYDCKFTHFRLLEILLEHGYTHRFALSEHPDYETIRDTLETIEEFTVLSDSDNDWLEQGYVDPPYLYCDAGTELWRRMMPDAQPVEKPRLAEVVRDVALAAETQNDVELIAIWHALGYATLTPLDPRDDPDTTAIREIAVRTEAIEFPLPDGYRPPLGVDENEELEHWWAGQ